MHDSDRDGRRALLMRALRRSVPVAVLLLALALLAAGCVRESYWLTDEGYEEWERLDAEQHLEHQRRLDELRDEADAQRRLLTWLLADANSYPARSAAQDGWVQYAMASATSTAARVHADAVVWAVCTDHALREQLLADHSPLVERLRDPGHRGVEVECDVPEGWVP